MKIGLLSILTAFSLCFLSNNVMSERYEVAAHNYQNEKYDLAYDQFLGLSSLGNKDAQYALGLMHLKGLHVAKDINAAYAWVTLSGSKGNPAYMQMAKNIKEAIPPSALDQAESAYQILLADYGDNVIEARLMPKLTKSDTGSFKRLKPLVKVPAIYPHSALKAGIFGNATVRYIVADDGRVKYPEIESSTDQSFINNSLKGAKSFVYKPASINGVPVSTFGIRNRFIFELTSGQVVQEKRLYSSLLELKEKADSGTSIDRYKYAHSARMLRSYLNPSKRDEFHNSTEYFSKAAVDGLPHAKFELGKSILYGEQCKSDFDASYFWLHDAAQDGIPQAQLMLGMERLYGVRFDADIDEGVKWLEAAASKYDPAKVELSVVIATRLQGDQRDLAKAKSLLDSIKDKSFEDKVSLYEARALVHTAMGNQKGLAKSLKKLEKEAKKLKLPYDVLASNIERRLAGEPVFPLKS